MQTAAGGGGSTLWRQRQSASEALQVLHRFVQQLRHMINYGSPDRARNDDFGSGGGTSPHLPAELALEHTAGAVRVRQSRRPGAIDE